MSLPVIDDPKHWRIRADEARLMADSLADAVSEQIMLEVADGYERLAKRAAERMFHSADNEDLE
jgi:hypothetical protein